MKVGDKLMCKKDFFGFEKGSISEFLFEESKKYEISDIIHTSRNYNKTSAYLVGVEYGNDLKYFFDCSKTRVYADYKKYTDFFYTKVEYRKIKIQKILE